MKFSSLAFIFLLFAPAYAQANQNAKNAVDAYFEAIRNKNYASVANMITQPELDRFKSIWIPFVISATKMEQAKSYIRDFTQGQSPRLLQTVDSKEILVRFLHFSENIDSASDSFQAPSNYSVHRYSDSTGLPSLIINYYVGDQNIDMEYRFDNSDGNWKLFLPDPILHSVNKVARYLRDPK